MQIKTAKIWTRSDAIAPCSKCLRYVPLLEINSKNVADSGRGVSAAGTANFANCDASLRRVKLLSCRAVLGVRSASCSHSRRGSAPCRGRLRPSVPVLRWGKLLGCRAVLGVRVGLLVAPTYAACSVAIEQRRAKHLLPRAGVLLLHRSNAAKM